MHSLLLWWHDIVVLGRQKSRSDPHSKVAISNRRQRIKPTITTLQCAEEMIGIINRDSWEFSISVRIHNQVPASGWQSATWESDPAKEKDKQELGNIFESWTRKLPTISVSDPPYLGFLLTRPDPETHETSSPTPCLLWQFSTWKSHLQALGIDDARLGTNSAKYCTMRGILG